MIELTLSEIAQILDAQLDGSPDIRVSGISTDSRTVSPGDLFVAIVGERVDGHDYVETALQNGATAVLATRKVAAPMVLVPQAEGLDGSIVALGALAKAVRTRLDGAVIGVTGSSGKTSTKDLIGHVLRAQGSTIAPVGSPNNELGLPMTLLSADEQTEFIVLEMGMRGLGHIAYLCDIAAPTIGVITNIGSAHVGELGGIAQVAQAKGELIEALPVNGTAVLNFDDPLVRSLAQKTRATVLSYGLNANCDVHCVNLVSTKTGGHEFALVTPTGSAQVKLELPGEHNVSNALAAAAVGHCVGMSASEIAAALSTARLQSKWRMEFHHLPNDITLINDAYNANPDSMAAALKTLVTISSDGRKWAVLGAMHELGDLTIEEHDRIGRLAVRLDVDQLVVVGQAAKPLHLGAQTEGSWDQESVWFPDFEQAADYICQKVAPHDVVLFKASRSEGFEQLAQLVETRLRKDECS